MRKCEPSAPVESDDDENIEPVSAVTSSSLSGATADASATGTSTDDTAASLAETRTRPNPTLATIGTPYPFLSKEHSLMLVAITWSEEKTQIVDVDLAAIVFHTNGIAADCIYFNRTHTADRSVVLLSGDRKNGAKGEEILIDFRKLPPDTEKIAFVATSYTPQCPITSLRDITVTVRSFFASLSGHENQQQSCERRMNYISTPLIHCESGKRGDILAIAHLEKNPNVKGGDLSKQLDWSLTLHAATLEGRTLMDVLPSVRSLLHLNKGELSTRFSIPIVLQKDEEAVLHAQNGPLRVGTGWDMVPKNTRSAAAAGVKGGATKKEEDEDEEEEGDDVDLSCVLVSGRGEVLDTVFWGKLQAYDSAIVHGGDNRTGEGEGDDEIIYVNLSLLPPEVCGLFFVVSNYSSGNLSSVANVHFRVVRECDQAEVIRYNTIGAGGAYSSFIPCYVVRSSWVQRQQQQGEAQRTGNRRSSASPESSFWLLRGLSLPVHGHTIHDPAIQQVIEGTMRSGHPAVKPVDLRTSMNRGSGKAVRGDGAVAAAASATSEPAQRNRGGSKGGQQPTAQDKNEQRKKGSGNEKKEAAGENLLQKVFSFVVIIIIAWFFLHP